VLDGASVLEELDGTNATSIKYFNNPQQIDEVLAYQRGSQTEFPLTDALGSLYAATDASGNVVHRYDFDAYGKRTDLGGSAPAVDRGFTMREHDAWGGINNRVRELRPDLGAWMQPDRFNYGYEKSRGRQSEPLGSLAKLVGYGRDASYAYVGNHPTMATDPSGMWLLWGLTGFPGYNVEWWSSETPESEELQRIWSDVAIGEHWNVAFPVLTFSGGCDTHADRMIAAMNKLGLRFFTPSRIAISPIPAPIPPYAVHAVVLLTPIPPSRLGRVFVDSYIWPAMGDIEPDDDQYFRPY